MNSFGILFTRRRKAMKISQKRFADMVGIGKSQLNKYEKGKTVPREDILARITDVLGVPRGSYDRHLWKPFPTKDGIEAEVRKFFEANKSELDWLMLFEFLQGLNERQEVLSIDRGNHMDRTKKVKSLS